jgi:hypothetical protein
MILDSWHRKHRHSKLSKAILDDQIVVIIAAAAIREAPVVAILEPPDPGMSL